MDPIKEMIEKIRAAMADCPAPERAVMAAVVEEAEGWKMRLRELEEEEEE